MSLLKEKFPEWICKKIVEFLKFKVDDEKRFENDYRIIEAIAKNSSYGDVYKVARKDTGIIYAVKVIQTMERKENLLQTFQEAVLPTRLSDRNIVRGYHELSWVVLPPDVDPEVVTNILKKGSDVRVEEILKLTGARFYMVFELFPADLTSIFPLDPEPNDILPKQTIDDVRRILADVISGLDYVHQSEFVHDDVKPDNFLIREEEDGSLTVICDMGRVQSLATAPKDRRTSGHLYYAPDNTFSITVDYWSVGMMAFHFTFISSTGRCVRLSSVLERLAMCANYGEVLNLRDFVSSYLPKVNNNLTESIVQCLQKTPKCRPTARVLLGILHETDNFRKASQVASSLHDQIDENFGEMIYPQWYKDVFLPKMKNFVDEQTMATLSSFVELDDFPLRRVHENFDLGEIREFAKIMKS